MSGRITIVANPVSGRGRSRRTAEAVANALRADGRDVKIELTARTGDAETITTEAARDSGSPCDCVVACGGDGTIQEVAHALAVMGQERPTLGLAPAGRCNDFARALGVSTDPGAIANVIAHGRATPIDLGRVNGRHFCTVATLGIDAEVSSFVDTMRMPLRGTPAYLYGALRVLMRYRPHSLRISGDFAPIEGPVFLASSANTSSYGGAIPIAPDAVPNDGWLDLCVIDRVSRLRALRLIPVILGGRHGSLPEVHFYRTRRIEIHSEEPVELWADGERIGQTPAIIEVVPAAVQVMLPADGRFSKRLSAVGSAGENS